MAAKKLIPRVPSKHANLVPWLPVHPSPCFPVYMSPCLCDVAIDPLVTVPDSSCTCFPVPRLLWPQVSWYAELAALARKRLSSTLASRFAGLRVYGSPWLAMARGARRKNTRQGPPCTGQHVSGYNARWGGTRVQQGVFEPEIVAGGQGARSGGSGQAGLAYLPTAVPVNGVPRKPANKVTI
jgi:hypothetical protein